MGINLARIRKDDIVWMQNHRCVHNHTYLEHQSCYLEENPTKQRLCFLDLECSALIADFGIILCYCIMDDKTGKIYKRLITPHELKSCEDEKVVRSCIKDLERFDKMVGYYSTKFDIPFLRTRATIMDIPIPGFGAYNHQDLYYVIRNRFRLSRNRLDNACNVLLGSTEKTRLEPTLWRKAMTGHQKSLDYILDHCEKDVAETRRLYHKVIDFSKKTDKSW